MEDVVGKCSLYVVSGSGHVGPSDIWGHPVRVGAYVLLVQKQTVSESMCAHST